LNKQPDQYDQTDQNQQYGAGYFPECFQLGVIKCKFMFSVLLRKSNTSKSLNFNNWLPDEGLSVKWGAKDGKSPAGNYVHSGIQYIAKQILKPFFRFVY